MRVEHQKTGSASTTNVRHRAACGFYANAGAHQARAHEHAEEVGNAPKEQRRDAEERDPLDIQVPRFAEVGGQPGNVEIPAPAKTEILQAYHPDLR
jgi:hypothetical protein